MLFLPDHLITKDSHKSFHHLASHCLDDVKICVDKPASRWLRDYKPVQHYLLFIRCEVKYLFHFVRKRHEVARLEICQNIYTTKFSCVRILHIENS